MADTDLLQCGGTGYALASAKVTEKSNGRAIIAITGSEEDNAPIVEYIIASGLKDLKNGTSTTIIAQEEGGETLGGVRTQAILLRLFEGQKSRRLAMNGNVYDIVCAR